MSDKPDSAQTHPGEGRPAEDHAVEGDFALLIIGVIDGPRCFPVQPMKLHISAAALGELLDANDRLLADLRTMLQLKQFADAVGEQARRNDKV